MNATLHMLVPRKARVRADWVIARLSDIDAARPGGQRRASLAILGRRAARALRSDPEVRILIDGSLFARLNHIPGDGTSCHDHSRPA